MGRTLDILLGDVHSSSDFDHFASACELVPPDSYDFLLRSAEFALDTPSQPFLTPWTSRALASYTPNVSAAVRRYKPVDRKVRPVPTYMPNPSAQKFKPIPAPEPAPLSHHPRPLSEFVETGRLTRERLDKILTSVPEGFLTGQEIDLLVSVLQTRQNALAWTDDERGTFSREYFPDYEIPIIEHTPWVREPIRIPKAIEKDVTELLQKQMRAGKYEYSSASYRSRCFPVAKGDTGKLRLVHDLQDLNKYAIRDSALPPRPDDFAESFVGFAIYGVADLFSGFDARTLAEASRDLTTFHCLQEPWRLTTLPQGFTNSVAEFQRCVNHALTFLILLGFLKVFIDDVAMKGGRSRYNDAPLSDNPEIRLFVYEYAVKLDMTFLCMIMAGITASGTKLILATPKVRIVGSIVSHEGWHLAHGIATKVLNWPTPESVSEVRGFLGVAGVGRRWIKDFSLIAKPLTQLCRKTDDLFVFTQEAQNAMDILKKLVASAPILKVVDYELAKLATPPPRVSNHGLVVLVVDSSIHGSGWVLYQHIETDKHPVLFGSCTFNRTESQYSQPKVELYGVFRAVKEMRHRVWGIHFLLEVDAKFLKEMIKEPDLPNALMTRWVSYIQLFDFHLEHVPARLGVAQDGMSRRRPSGEDSDESDAEAYLDEFLGLSGFASDKEKDTALTRLSLFVAYTYDHMESRKPLGFDRSPKVVLSNEPEVAIVSPGTFASARAQRIEERGERLREIPPSLRAWDSNIRSGQPEWYWVADTEVDRGLYPASETPFHPALIRNEDDVSYIGMEFAVRKEGREDTAEFVLGDETLTLAFIEYRPAYIETEEMAAPQQEFQWQLAVSAAERRYTGRGDTSHLLRCDNRKHYVEALSPQDATEIPCIAHVHAAKAEDSDLFWSDITNYLATGNTPEQLNKSSKALRVFESKAKRFTLRDGRLWRIHESRFPQLVITDNLRRLALIEEAHRVCGHKGREATYSFLKDRYFWPSLYDDIAWHVRSCNACQYRSRIRPKIPISPSLSPSVLKTFAFDTIHMPLGLFKFRYLFHASCVTGKWSEARGTRKNNSRSMATFMWEDVICRFGCIPVFRCDGGPEMRGAVRILLEEHKVVVVLSSPYHPEGNGIAERDGQTLYRAIMKACAKDPRQWPLYVHAALWAQRTTVSHATGYTPYFLTYGQHTLLPFDITDRTWFVLDWEKVRSTSDLLAIRMQQLARREEDIGRAMDHLEQSRQRSADDRNRTAGKHLRVEKLEPGTWVLVHETWLDLQHGNKGSLRWAGPYVVHQCYESGSYALRELDGTLLKESVAGSRIKIFHFRDRNQSMSTTLEPISTDNQARSDRLHNAMMPRFCGTMASFDTDYDHQLGRVRNIVTLKDILLPAQDNSEDFDVVWHDELAWYGGVPTFLEYRPPRYRTNFAQIFALQDEAVWWR